MAIQHARPQRTKVPTRPRWQSKYHGVRMTPEQYLQLPEEKPYLEYVDGVVLQKPMFTQAEGELALEVAWHIGKWVKPNGGARRDRCHGEARRTAQLPSPRYLVLEAWYPPRRPDAADARY